MTRWKPVVGFEDRYIVSEEGDVFSMLSGKVLASSINKNGDPVVTLVSEGNAKHVLAIRRLVAAAFVPNPEGLPSIRHLNGNRLDNRAQNIVWSLASNIPSRQELEPYCERRTSTLKGLARRYGVALKTANDWLRRYRISMTDVYATCPSCGRTFKIRRNDQIYCSMACEMRARVQAERRQTH